MSRTGSMPAARPRPHRTEAPLDLVSWGVGAALLVLYAVMASPVSGDKDSGEFALVLATRGLAHPTGYPLYTMLGAGFVQAAHALGTSWAHAANLWSALAGALAMGGLHAVTARLIVPSSGARAAAVLALLPILAFGLNPMWTLETTLAEVNALHLAWVMLAALVARSGLAALADADSPAARVRIHAAAWGLVVGGGLAHHLTSVLIALPLTLVLVAPLARRRAGAARAVGIGIVAALVPLVSYAWVAWRAAHPVAGQWAEMAPGFGGLMAHITGAQYRQYLGHFAPGVAQRAFLSSFVYPWLVPAGIGALVAVMLRTPVERPWRIGLALAVLVQVGYAFSYGVPDPSSYFLPALALGLALFVAALARLVPVRRHAAVFTVVLGVVLLVPAAGGWQLAQARNRAYAGLETLIGQMWQGLPPGPAFVVWDDDMAVRLRSRQLVNHERPDVEIVQPRRLMNDQPRRRFVAAHGFDPTAGISITQIEAVARDEAGAQAIIDSIVAHLNAGSAQPVILFLPQVPSLRLLKKPGAVEP